MFNQDLKQDYWIIIPSRISSTRLPEKPLRKIHGLELINNVILTASATNQRIVVAVDNQQIAEVINQALPTICANPAQVQVVMTSTSHQNGTERLAEVIEILGIPDDEVVINIQGDEPFFNYEIIDDLYQDFLHQSQSDSRVVMSTICQRLAPEEVSNPNAVKVILNQNHQAIYFSRSQIPYTRNVPLQEQPFYKHAGVYCYTAKFIKEYKALPMTPLAHCESLEQLKIMEYGYSISVMEITGRGFIGVDTQEDLDRAVELTTPF